MLDDLQAWMQAAILDGSGDADGRVRSTNTLTAGERLGIYQHSYRARLIECLRSEYPMLAALAGETAFALFARGYIAAYPSHSYTLYDFGTGFADYLEAARPKGDGTPQTVEAVPAALARIERARAEVARARGIEHAEAAHAPASSLDPLVAAMFGLDRRGYRRPDSVRLLALPFDFTETLAAAEHEAPPVLPRPEPGWVAVARVDYRVACHRIERWQYDWLVGLGEAEPAPLPPGDPELAAWVPMALALGLVASA